MTTDMAYDTAHADACLPAQMSALLQWLDHGAEALANPDLINWPLEEATMTAEHPGTCFRATQDLD